MTTYLDASPIESLADSSRAGGSQALQIGAVALCALLLHKHFFGSDFVFHHLVLRRLLQW